MGTFRQILEGPRPVKKSRLTISVSWRPIMPPKPDTSVLEIFGEMEFRERQFGKGSASPSPATTPTPLLLPSPTPLLLPPSLTKLEIEEIEEVRELDPERVETCGRRMCLRCNSDSGSRVSGAGFPLPISSMGRNGKPRVYYRPIKREGRFVLQEIRIPGQGCMHVTRENGRLLLQLSSSDSSDG